MYSSAFDIRQIKLVVHYFEQSISCFTQLEEELFKAKLGVILTIRLSADLTWENYIKFRNQLDPKVHIDLLI